MSNDTDTPGQGADALDQIAAEGAMLEATPNQAQEAHAKQQAQAEAAQLQNEAGQLLFALESARMIAAPMFAWWPEFGDTWSDRQLSAISEAGAAVMQRHGWTLEDLGRFGPYIALGMATVPPGLATYQALKLQREQLQRQPEAGQP